jgi:hypothetical protein
MERNFECGETVLSRYAKDITAGDVLGHFSESTAPRYTSFIAEPPGSA